jgi:hypothetical protein
MLMQVSAVLNRDDRGRRADFHSLRHSYGTLLAKSGVAPRMAMALMRHTDMRLTMNVYTDPRIFDLAGAVEKLPTLQWTHRSRKRRRQLGPMAGRPAQLGAAKASVLRRQLRNPQTETINTTVPGFGMMPAQMIDEPPKTSDAAFAPMYVPSLAHRRTP